MMMPHDRVIQRAKGELFVLFFFQRDFLKGKRGIHWLEEFQLICWSSIEHYAARKNPSKYEFHLVYEFSVNLDTESERHLIINDIKSIYWVVNEFTGG